MGQTSVTINGRSYEILCNDGQEDHLRKLAAYVDSRVAEVVASAGQVGDMRLLVLASLMIADDLHTANGRNSDEREAPEKKGEESEARELSLARLIEQLSERIEAIAARLEAS